MGSRRRVRGTPVGSAPAWLYAAAACFLLYYGVIAYSDLLRREATGLLVEFDERGAAVAWVVPGSEAERAGVRQGDRVRTYLDRPVSSRLDWTGVEANLAVSHPVVLENRA